MKAKRNLTTAKAKKSASTVLPVAKPEGLLPAAKNCNQFSAFDLRDLSPIRPLYGTIQSHTHSFTTPSHLSFIETPVKGTQITPYLDQVDKEIRYISGVIPWQKNSSIASESAGQDDQFSSCSSGSESEKEQEKEVQPQPQKQNQLQKKEEESNFIGVEVSQLSDRKNTPEPKSPTSKRVTCNCKKTQCLKLYCDCFRMGVTCGEGCNCVGCHNLSSYQDERNNAMINLIDRNPLAFVPKIDTEKQHSKGCNCKKSNCQKKYCECYQAGIKCAQHCRCEDCKNRTEEEGHSCTAKKQNKFEEWIC